MNIPALPYSKREQRGWYMYDFANSTFASTVLTLFLGPYLTALEVLLALALRQFRGGGPPWSARRCLLPAPEREPDAALVFSSGALCVRLPVSSSAADNWFCAI